MFKKTTLAALLAAAVLTLGTADTFANSAQGKGAQSDRGRQEHSYKMEQMEKMTPEQKEVWKDWKQKNLTIQKKMISKQVEWNWITPEAGKLRIEKMETWAANENPGERIGATKQSKGDHQKGTQTHQKKLNIQGNITDEQKAEMQNWKKEMVSLRKEWTAQQLQWGWLTQDQADRKNQRLDNWETREQKQPGLHKRGPKN
ncbi:MAG: DUF2680 domain-containing protein [Negativicutes bacterium]|jgi:hypothetical protein|nr:DUF2680 domain-containing protein [Negativicutes bacterium]